MRWKPVVAVILIAMVFGIPAVTVTRDLVGKPEVRVQYVPVPVEGLPGGMSIDEASTYYCPDYGSAEAAQAKPSPYTLSSATSEDILVMGPEAMVRLVGSASTTGLIRICGGGATLVIDTPHPNLRAYVLGGGARFIIIDRQRDLDYFDPTKVVLNGGGAEVISCGVKLTNIRPCTAYLPFP